VRVLAEKAIRLETTLQESLVLPLGVRLRFQFTAQPCKRQFPITPNRDVGDVHCLGCLFNTQTAENAELHDLTLARIELGQMLKSFVECEEVNVLTLFTEDRSIQRHLIRLSSAFFGIPGARVVNQDAPHHLSAHSEKVAPVLPLNILPIDESNKG